MSGNAEIDPITFQVINSYCDSITREMGMTMIRTAYSPIFVVAEDFACAVMDRHAEMIAMDRRASCHVSSMAFSSQWAVVELGYENLAPGDVILSNDPFMGGSHIPDYMTVKPIFYKGELVAMVGNKAHHLDTGGNSPGGFDANATEIYHEGICFPPVKWYKEGVEDRAITDILLENVRVPEIQIGDFKAQLASLDVAERRIHALCDKYGPDAVTRTFDAIKDYSERMIRKEIEALPDGEWTFEDFISDDGIHDVPLRVRVQVKISGSDIAFDFTGTSNQSTGPMNAPYGVTASSVFNALLQVTDPSIAINHGCYRPIRIIAPRGTLVNPSHLAPVVGGNTHTAITIMEAILGAFAQFIPERVTAANYGTVLAFNGGGYDRERKRPFMWGMVTVGGWGGRKGMDGWDSIFAQQSNCRATNAEILEMQQPITNDTYGLYVDAGGAGKWRGGCGTVRTFTFQEDAIATFWGDRHKMGPFGIMGGLPARPNAALIRRNGAAEFKPIGREFDLLSEIKGTVRIKKGDTIALVQTAGGGYGNPFERDSERVKEDLENHFISEETAREDYGVVGEWENGEFRVDLENTAQLRQSGLKHPLNIVAGVISVDDEYLAAAERLRDIDFIEKGKDEDWIWKAKHQIPEDFCRRECIKGADPLRCPWYDENALNFWPTHRLTRWTERHCPLRKNAQFKFA